MTVFMSAAQALDGETPIMLFQLDLTPLGEVGTVLYFCNYGMDPLTHALVSFGGVSYEGIDVDASGFELTGQGAIPQPTLRISNVNSFASGLLLQYGNLIGANVNRVRTFARYLDGHTDASLVYGANPPYQLDTYRVEQKIAHNKVFAELRLASPIDQEGQMLPKHRVLRDTCGSRYRGYVAATDSFDYSKATCPFAADVFFDINGNIISNRSGDTPSKKFATCCKPRFPTATAYPFGGFPGVQRNQ